MSPAKVESEHVRALLAEHGLTLSVSPAGRGAYFLPRERHVVINRHCPHLYVAALHEIGHAVIGASERGAWRWAEQNSVRPFSPAEQLHVRKSLQSYGI